MTRSTADRMRDRQASLHIFRTIPAVGHMPFAGHRPLSEIGSRDDKADRYRRNALRMAAE